MFRQFGHGIDVVFANEDEIRALYPGHGSDYEALARELASHDVIAAVKMGRDGAWIAKGDEIHRIAPIHACRRGRHERRRRRLGRRVSLRLPAGPARSPNAGPSPRSWESETVRHLGPLIPDAAWAET